MANKDRMIGVAGTIAVTAIWLFGLYIFFKIESGPFGGAPLLAIVGTALLTIIATAGVVVLMGRAFPNLREHLEKC